jgi:hypothetical protein
MTLKGLTGILPVFIGWGSGCVGFIAVIIASLAG